MNIVATLVFAFLAQNAAVQGTVVRSGGTEPLSKATVELRTDQENATPFATLTTEENGQFVFQSVRPGRYRLTVTRRGFARPPLTVTVAPGQPVTDVLLPMSPTGVITGRVYDANGEPFGNIMVQALKATFLEGRRTLAIFQTTHTNDLGEYRLFWLPSGRYYVVAVHPQAQSMVGLRFSAIGVGTTMLGSGPGQTFLSSSTTFDPALQRYDEDEDPRRDRYMPVYFGGTVHEQQAAAIDVRGGAEIGGANIVVTPMKARRVRGIIVDGTTGQPVEYGSISTPMDRVGPRSREVEVDRERATFETFLLPGVYTFTASSASGTGQITFKVAESDIENLTIPTMRGFDVTGVIGFEDGSKNHALLEQLRITLRRDPPPIGDQPITAAYSVPLETGAFTLDGDVGDFRVNIVPILNLYTPRAAIPPALEKVYVKSIRLGDADVLNGVLRLERKPPVPLEIVLGTNPGGIDGTVVRVTRGSVADMTVVLVPNVRRRFDLYKTVITDSAGRFHFPNIPPGDYKVFAWEEIETGIWYDAEFMREQENRGQAVRIVEGQQIRISNFEIQK